MKKLIIAVLFVFGASAEARTTDMSTRGVNHSPAFATKQMALNLQAQNQEARNFGWSAREIGVSSVTIEQDGSVTVQLIVVSEPAGGYEVTEPVLRYSSLQSFRKAAAGNPQLIDLQ